MSKPKKDRYVLNVLIALALYLIFLILPPVEPLTKSGMVTIGLFFALIYLWITVGIGWTSMAVIFLIPTTGLFTFAQTLERSIGDNIPTMVLFCLMLSYALKETGFLRRIAVFMMTRPFTKGNGWLFFVMFCVATFVVGCFMSFTVTTVVFMALAEEIMKGVGYEKGGADKMGKTFASSIVVLTGLGAMATLISHPWTLIGVNYANEQFGANITMFSYSLVGLPVALIILILLLLFVRFFIRPDFGRLNTVDIEALKASIPNMDRRELITGIAFVLVVVLWIAPDFLAPFAAMKGVIAFIKTWGSTGPPLLGALIVMLARVKGKPIADMKAVMKDVSWETFMLIACAMVIGDCLVAEGSGITAFLTAVVGPVITGFGGILFVLLVYLWVVIQTNFMSNAICAMLVSVIGPIALTLSSVNPMAICALVGAASGLAFATPAATTTPAYVLGLGWTDTASTFKYGSIMAIAGALVLTFVGYPLACILF